MEVIQKTECIDQDLRKKNDLIKRIVKSKLTGGGNGPGTIGSGGTTQANPCDGVCSTCAKQCDHNCSCEEGSCNGCNGDCDHGCGGCTTTGGCGLKDCEPRCEEVPV